MSYDKYRQKQPKATIPDIDSVKDMEKTLKSLGMKESVKESLTPAEVKKERELFKKTGELPPRLQKVVDDYEKERKAFHKKMKKKFKGNVKGDWVDVVVPGLEWMADIKEELLKEGPDPVKMMKLYAPIVRGTMNNMIVAINKDEYKKLKKFHQQFNFYSKKVSEFAEEFL